MSISKWNYKPTLIKVIGTVVSSEPSVNEFLGIGNGGFTFHHIYPGNQLKIIIEGLTIAQMRGIISVPNSLYPNPNIEANGSWWEVNDDATFKANLKSALYWAPGNLCLGPRQRVDDPEDGTEGTLRNGIVIPVNNTEEEVLAYLRNCMRVYPKSSGTLRSSIVLTREGGSRTSLHLDNAALPVNSRRIYGNYYELNLVNLKINWSCRVGNVSFLATQGLNNNNGNQNDNPYHEDTDRRLIEIDIV